MEDFFLNRYDVKFVLNFDDYEYSTIENGFNKIKGVLNWKFDENFNATPIEDTVEYQVIDVSNLTENNVKEITKSFFDFTYDNIINVPLYKFLILKNDKKFRILANINSLIFDYSSINSFYELFDNSDKHYPQNDLNSYYNNVENYLNSIKFEEDSKYWKKHVLNSKNCIKFYNLKENNYKSQKININQNSIFNFIKDHDCTLFEFYGSIFSLYLSRIDRLDSCLLKTSIPHEKNDSYLFDKNTLLKIDIDKDCTFNELLTRFNSSFDDAVDHTKVNYENYLDETVSYYSVYDFSDLNENINVYNGEGSALTLNVYGNYLELIYNSNLFSDSYIKHMTKNIEHLIRNLLNSPNQIVIEADIISNEEKKLMGEFCKGKTVEVDDDKLVSKIFREHAMRKPEALAIDDGVNQVSYGELEKTSNSIAYDLKENHNITVGSRVALMLPRTYHFPELVLALNKIGAAFIPIDPIYPPKRIEHMLNLAEADYIITTEEFATNYDFKENVIPIESLNANSEVELDILCEIGRAHV